MAEKQNNAGATAGNIAHKLHGTAQIVRGAVTAAGLYLPFLYS